MSEQSKVCACAVCTGAQCKCGCQNSTTRAASCSRYGDACKCAERCSCKVS